MNKRDATSSWSGFSYQGKVTIYYALRLINELDTDMTKYRIEIEGAEDFSLLVVEEDGTDKYLSMHQVKHKYSTHTLNGYIDAIVSLYFERRDECTCYMHIAKEVTDWTYKSFCTNINRLIDGLKINEKVDELKILQSLTESKSKSMMKKTTEMPAEIEELNKYKKKLINLKTTEVFNNIKLFSYDFEDSSKSYCNGNDIEKLIDSCICQLKSIRCFN